MNAGKIISLSLDKAIKVVVGSDNFEFELLPSNKDENGDYFTNVALRLSSVTHEKPQDIAYKIKDEFENIDIPEVEKIEIASPGFINFFLSDKYLKATIEYIEENGEEFGQSNTLLGATTLVEYTDPNPFKELHIGHLYSNIIGESLSRLFESQGARVKRVCYQGDVGLHVAKAIYGMQSLQKEIPHDSAPLSDRARFMGRAYTLGAKAYEEAASAKGSPNQSSEQVGEPKDEINSLNKTIYEQSDAVVNELYTKGRKWSLEYFDELYKRLGTKFDHFYFESNMAKIGIQLVQEFLTKGVFRKSDGAIIYPGEEHGLHNRVFINSIGLPTYEAKDLALAITKEKDYSPDKSVIITGSEQIDYMRVVYAAIEQIEPQIAAKTTHIPHGMVRLPTGKMSSRTGDVITGEWLLDEAVARVSNSYPEMPDAVAEKVGMAAVKYAMLKGTIGRDITFNFDESIALEGSSGPYLLYTYVRTRSVLEKGQKLKTKDQKNSLESSLNDEESAILRHLIHFPEVIAEAQNKLSPNLLALYLFVLSQKFNLFYQKHKIAENEFRLALTKTVGQTLSNGLKILGIETVNKM